MFVNGVSVAGGTPAAFVQNSDSPFNIASRSDGGFGWNGTADEVALYPSALSASLVAAHFDAVTTNAAGYATQVLASAPAGYWRLDEATPVYPVAANSGSLGASANANYVNGVTTATGPTSPAFPGFGASNPCGKFDGTSGSVPSLLSLLNNRAQFTVMGWVKRGAVHSERGGYFGQNDLLEFGDASAGTSIEAWVDAAGGNLVTPYPWADDEWGFIALTADGTDAKLYLNGALTDTLAASVASYGSNTFKFNIGGGGIFNVSGDFFNGSIDEVAVFDKSVTSGRILSLYLTATGSTTPPFMVSDPPVQTPPGAIYATTTFSLTADVAGASPISFQWRTNGTAIAGAIFSTYTKANAALSDAASYDCVAANAYGSVTSAVVIVTINPAVPVSITSAPQSRSVYLGGKASFTVGADGTTPLTYQWKKAGADIASATNQVLTLTNLSAADAATYSVGVTNVAGGIVSAGALLTVVSPTAGSYAEAVLTNGPVNYWKLGESSGTTAFDSFGGLDGTYTNGVTLGVPGGLPYGGAGTAVDFDGTSGQILLNGSGIPAPWTAIFWVLRTDPIQQSGALIDDRTAPVSSSLRVEQWQNSGKVGFTHYGVADFTYGYGTPSGVWVQLTFVGRATGTDLYVDGVLTDSSPNSIQLPRRIIGASTSADFLKGTLDEISLFNKELSAASIATIYAAGAYGTVTPPLVTRHPASTTQAVGSTVALVGNISGSLPITYQWKKNGVNVPGASSAVLTLSNVFFTDAASYMLYATNSIGFTSTTAATLTVLPQPSYANLTNDLVLHLKFDGNYLDTSGRNNNASAPGGPPAFVSGKLGSSVNLNAAGANYLTVSDLTGDFLFDSTNSFTVALWLKYSAAFNDTPIIGNAVNSTYQPGWVLTEDGGRFEWTAVGGASIIADPVGGPLINNGAWHHLAVAFNRANGTASSFVDGVRVNSRSLSGLGSLITGNTLTIGQDPNGAYGVANFDLDDVGIWRRALTDYEALSIYNAAQNSGVSFDTYGPVEVYIQPVSGSLYISWQSGTLLESTSVTGVYTPVSGASAPFYVTTPSAVQKFYRVQQ
jgi:hypothetical protein